MAGWRALGMATFVLVDVVTSFQVHQQPINT